MSEFDEVLREWYEQSFGVKLTLEEAADGQIDVSVTGRREQECAKDLKSLDKFQVQLAGWKADGTIDGLVGGFKRQIKGQTTRDN